MVWTTSVRAVGFTAVVLAMLLLTACSNPTPTTTETATSPPAVRETPTSAPQASATPTSTSAPTPTSDIERCATEDLTGTIGEQDGMPPGTGEGMSQLHVAIILANHGDHACRLQGWPGVSLVGEGDGTQLGAAAQFDRSAAHPTVILQPGGRAQAPLHYVDPGVYDTAGCRPADADGFRVYPPGSRTSLFIAHPLQACTLKKYDLITVGALVSYP